jgi:predicted PurR-regulated permease PerM
VVRVELGLRDVLLVLGLVVAALLVYVLRDVVVLVGLALMLTAALTPLVARAERRGWVRAWAVALVMIGLVLLPLVILAAISPLLISEVSSMGNNVPALQAHVDLLLRHMGLVDRVNQAIAKSNSEDRLGSLALVSAQRTLSIGIQVITVVVITGYLLADGPRLRLLLHDFIPRLSERHIEPLLQGMQRVVGGYIRGQIVTSLMFGAYAFVLCLALGVPSPLLLGVVAAAGDVIPLFGVPAAMLLAALLAFTQSTWQPIAVVVGYILYGQLESHLIVPRIYARTVNLSPLMVILATIAGGAADGIIGILIGIPIVGVLKVIFDYVVAERRSSHEQAAAALAGAATDRAAEERSMGAAEFGEQVEVPLPTISPFEPIPDGATDTDTVEEELLLTASARILRLEEQVARLLEIAGPERHGQAGGERLRPLP